MSVSTIKLTYDDYVLIPEDGLRHEIINGEHVVSPAPSVRHQIVLMNLSWHFMNLFKERGVGRVLVAPVDVHLDEHNIVQPDLVVVLNENDIIGPAKITGSPDHLIEILSPSTAGRDRSEKLSLYERSGVGEYWIVDPIEQFLIQHVLNNGTYQANRLTEDVQLSYLPDAPIDLRQVWES